jgi:hypothetical protein
MTRACRNDVSLTFTATGTFGQPAGRRSTLEEQEEDGRDDSCSLVTGQDTILESVVS